MSLGCWMRTKSHPMRCTTPAANLQVHLDFSCSCAALTCFVEAKTPPTVVRLVWVLKLLMYMWYSNLLVVSCSIFLMKTDENEETDQGLLSQLSYWQDCRQRAAPRCQALPPVALFLSQSSWLQSVVFQFVALELYPLLLKTFRFCVETYRFFVFPFPRVNRVLWYWESWSWEWAGNTDPAVWQKSRYKGSCYKKKHILCFANNSWVGLSVIAVFINSK